MLFQLVLVSALSLGNGLLIVPNADVQETEANGNETIVRSNWPIDLIFVLDGSGSVGEENFHDMKTWVKNVSRKFNIDNGSVRIGVIQHSYYYEIRPIQDQTYIKTEIQLDETSSYEDFASKVDAIKLQGYRTYTAHAMLKAKYDFEQKSRHNATKVVIVVVDGVSDDNYLIPNISKQVRDSGVICFSVGIKFFNHTELQIVATGNTTNNDRVFTMDSFNKLGGITEEIFLQIQNAARIDQQKRQASNVSRIDGTTTSPIDDVETTHEWTTPETSEWTTTDVAETTDWTTDDSGETTKLTTTVEIKSTSQINSKTTSNMKHSTLETNTPVNTTQENRMATDTTVDEYSIKNYKTTPLTNRFSVANPNFDTFTTAPDETTSGAMCRSVTITCIFSVLVFFLVS